MPVLCLRKAVPLSNFAFPLHLSMCLYTTLVGTVDGFNLCVSEVGKIASAESVIENMKFLPSQPSHTIVFSIWLLNLCAHACVCIHAYLTFAPFLILVQRFINWSVAMP